MRSPRPGDGLYRPPPLSPLSFVARSWGTRLSMCDLRFSDSAQLSSQSKLIETREGKRKKQTDAPLQHNERIAERPVNLFRSSSDYCGIGNSPMCSHWLSGPNGAYFVCRVVANGENEIHFRRIRFCEFIPAFAAQTRGGKFCRFQRF